MAKNKGGKNGEQKTDQRVDRKASYATSRGTRQAPQHSGQKWRPATSLVTAGRDPDSYHGFVNPPVYHASTVLYPSAEDFVAHRARYQYGRRGTPTTEALEGALQELEGPNCAGVSLLPSGLAAISAALMGAPPAVSAVPLRVSVPSLGSEVMLTLPSVSAATASEKPKSATLKV